MNTRTIYVPRLIESAEQAEALPTGTVAIHPPHPSGAVRVEYGDGWQEAGDEETADHEYMVGWVALVPIEAEQEHVAPDAITYTRYVTAWEEA